MPVHVSINGEQREFQQELSLLELLDRIDTRAEQRGIAIALNAEVVPRSEWSTRMVVEGDKVEVLTATQGG